MLIGYVRVSTNEQNTALQRNALESAGCELIFEDKASGKQTERPGLKKVLRMLSRGDTLVVWKLDRLGRSMRHLVVLVEELRDRGINFRSLTDSIDTSTPMGRFFFHVMGALAEMERELIVERTRAGLDAARAEGRIGGVGLNTKKKHGSKCGDCWRMASPVSRLQSSMMWLFPRFIRSFRRRHFNPKPWFKRTRYQR